jgi:hypothetical protein
MGFQWGQTPLKSDDDLVPEFKQKSMESDPIEIFKRCVG